MDFLTFFDIAERNMEIINPLSEKKIIKLGKYAGFGPHTKIIDFGCGFAEPMILWSREFGISAFGIDFRPCAIERATKKIQSLGMNDRLEVVLADGSKYEFEKHHYDAATCIGASFIWKGFQPALRVLKTAIKPGGKILIGEPYYLKDASHLPQDIFGGEKFYYETELLDMIRAENLELEFMVRSDDEDWLTYEAGNWQGFLAWLDENPDHPERNQVIDRLHSEQDTYIKYGREYLGWAVYILGEKRN